MTDEVIDENRREFLGTSAFVTSGTIVASAALAAPTSAQSTRVKGPAVIGNRA